MATEYLYAVQDETGREVVAWRGEVEKTGDVTVRRTQDGEDSHEVTLMLGDDALKSGRAPAKASLSFIRIDMSIPEDAPEGYNPKIDSKPVIKPVPKPKPKPKRD